MVLYLLNEWEQNGYHDSYFYASYNDYYGWSHLITTKRVSGMVNNMLCEICFKRPADRDAICNVCHGVEDDRNCKKKRVLKAIEALLENPDKKNDQYSSDDFK